MNTKKFLKKMTIEDKAKLLCGTGPFTCNCGNKSDHFAIPLTIKALDKTPVL